MDLTNDPTDIKAIQQWCIENILALLHANTGPASGDEDSGYDALEASHELVDSHPELIELLVQIAGDNFSFDNTATEPAHIKLSPREQLNKLKRSMAIEIVQQYAETSPEVKRIDNTRQFPYYTMTIDELLPGDMNPNKRARENLQRAQVNTVGKLMGYSVDDLLAITNFGAKSLDAVNEALAPLGMRITGSKP